MSGMALHNFDEEFHYRLMKKIENTPNVTQRQLAEEMGISLGKLNSFMKELISSGFVEIHNDAWKGRRCFIYVLTPEGSRAKLNMAIKTLEYKRKKYDQLGMEIAQLENELLRSEPYKHTKQ
jgi:EPS-associated MarR family transcriptional regulator